MTTPYHLLATAGSFIFAARGSSIHSFSSSLSHISTWRHPGSRESVASSASPGPPPSKRRRVGSDGGDDEEMGNDAVDEARIPEAESKEKVKEKDPKHQERPFLRALSVTPDGRHLVALTGSDKTIWVFERDGSGHLKLLSQRAMQKRPCAITVSYDGKTILSADKFGDVYSLPLIPSPTDGNKDDGTPAPTSRSATPSTPQPFKPQANEFTVHTKRNLRALENQKLGLQTKAPDQSTKPQFEHTLLLGHVSMLTAIAVVKSPHNGRPYIITGDRDEHIRISRAHPSHAHIIEGYCLGHDAFVTSLCSPSSRPQVLISGGGDEDLFVWKWENSGLLVNRPQLKSYVDAVVPGLEKIAVTRIVAGPTASPAHPVPIFVLCERVPAVFVFELNGTFLCHQATIRTPGNALDIVALPVAATEPQSFLVAVDPTAQCAYDGISLVRLGKEGASMHWRLDEDYKKTLEVGHGGISRDQVEKLLYATEKLRKSADGH